VSAPDTTLVTKPAPKAAHRLAALLTETAQHNASDLLLIAEAPPTIFTNGQWIALPHAPLGPDDVIDCLGPVLNEDQRQKLRTQRDLDVGFAIDGLGRYRMNVHYQRGSVAAAIRTIPGEPPDFDALGMPPQVLDFATFPSGLVLITGCTGQGKSTTLAALVGHMNRHRRAHVITIEDPIEFAFTHGTCLIEQRQIGDDCPTFAAALRHVLRQRPDVILIGELRDLETISTALTAAETGHLVFASLHTSSAPQTLSRIVDVFPAAQQPQIRTQLAGSIRAVLCQTLVRDQLNDCMIPATEILNATSAIRRAIRDNETHLIYSMIETGKRLGMHTLEQSLADLLRAGRITTDEAFRVTAEPTRLAKLAGCAIPAEVQAAQIAAQVARETEPIPWSNAGANETQDSAGVPPAP